MKTTHWILGLFMAAVLALAGCSKDKAPPTPKWNGVTVDMPALQKAFASASPALQESVGKVTFNLRYGDYVSALKDLDSLANNPSLTEPQKQIVTKVIGQMKELAAKQPAQATP